MSDTDYTLSSGAKLHVTSASFMEANALNKALLKSAKGVALTDDLMGADVSAFKDIVIEAMTSEDVERALFKCMERSSYNEVRLLPSTFDDPRLGDGFRKDYYEVAIRIMQVNCAPFFEKALSMWKARPVSVAASQRPAST